MCSANLKKTVDIPYSSFLHQMESLGNSLVQKVLKDWVKEPEKKLINLRLSFKEISYTRVWIMTGKNAEKLLHHYAPCWRAHFNKKPVEGSICMKMRLKQSLTVSSRIFQKKWGAISVTITAIARLLILHSHQGAHKYEFKRESV